MFENEREQLNRERTALHNERTQLNRERTALDDERTQLNRERTELHNERAKNEDLQKKIEMLKKAQNEDLQKKIEMLKKARYIKKFLREKSSSLIWQRYRTNGPYENKNPVRVAKISELHLHLPLVHRCQIMIPVSLNVFVK